MKAIAEIIFDNVSFYFNNKSIISDFSNAIYKGEHICLMGESGAGKTTLLNSIVGLTIPSIGEIKVGSCVVNSTNVYQIRSLTAWLPQELNLPYETVKQTLEAPYMLKVNKHLVLDKDKLFKLFAEVGLNIDIFDQDLRNISGGERQRLMLVSALMLGKKILLFDEPTSALDSINREKLTSFLKTLSDTTILAITHDEQFAKSFDRIITLRKI